MTDRSFRCAAFVLSALCLVATACTQAPEPTSAADDGAVPARPMEPAEPRKTEPPEPTPAPPPTPAPVTPVTPVTPEEPGERATTAPTLADLAQATYRGLGFAPEGTITLDGGVWEAEPLPGSGADGLPSDRATLIEQLYATGDLDGDGDDEAVVGLAQNPPGTGNFLYLAVFGGPDHDNLGTALVGDRVQVISLAVEDGVVHLDAVEVGPEDAMCCPTTKVRSTWELVDGELRETGSEVYGTLSLADLEGVEWNLAEIVHLGRAGGPVTEKVSGEVSITLELDGENLSGRSGCNVYQSRISGAGGGGVQVARIGSTKRGCPPPVMEWERRFLEALAGARMFGFQAGRLAITYDTEDGDLGTLLFERP